MGTWLWVFLFVFFILTLGASLYIFKIEENKMKHMRTEGDSAKDELRRSFEYESSSLKISVPVLNWMYAIFLIGSLVAFILYLI